MALFPRFHERLGYHRLFVWSLASFHTTLFAVALLTLVYFGGVLGEALGSLDTVTGLALFVSLWGVTFWSTRRAAQDLMWARPDQPLRLADMIRQGMVWAGANGALFLLALLTVVGISAAVAERNPTLLALPVLAVTGAPFSYTLGVVVGFLFGVLGWALFALSRRVFLACTRPSPGADA